MHTFSPCSYGQFPKAVVQHLYAFTHAHTHTPLESWGTVSLCFYTRTHTHTLRAGVLFWLWARTHAHTLESWGTVSLCFYTRTHTHTPRERGTVWLWVTHTHAHPRGLGHCLVVVLFNRWCHVCLCNLLFPHSGFCSQAPSPSVRRLGRIYLFLV